jgi:uridylate kinase
MYRMTGGAMPDLKFKRIMLKLSGEALCGEGAFGIDPASVSTVVAEVQRVQDLGVEIGIVIGGGNIWRGQSEIAGGIERATADYMGMLATVINAMALQDGLERVGILTRVQTAIEMRAVAEPYIRRRALRHLEKGRIVIFAAGTGNPFFTTDTAAALRAVEIGAQLLVKATKVDGIYDHNPKRHPEAKRFAELGYLQALNLKLEIMDSTALTLCMDNKLPILVVNLWQAGSIEKAVLGQDVGTLVH